MKPQPLNPDEAQLILDLMALYDACYEINHPRDCLCSFCSSLETVGEYFSSVHDSLTQKCSENAKKP
jgi:hypothetical protein